MKTIVSRFKSTFNIYGIKIIVTTEDGRIKENVGSFLRRFSCCSSHSSSDLNIRFDLATSAKFALGPSIPSSAVLISAPELPLKMYRTDDEYYIVFESSWLRLSLKDCFCFGVFDEGIWVYHRLIIQSFFLSGLYAILGACGLYLFHAAGLENDGKGYLILGKSGSGKSTATLSLMGQGWKYLGDDAVLLHQINSHTEALGIPIDFKADDQTVHKLLGSINDDFAIKIPHYANFPHFSKCFLVIDQLYPNQFETSCLPKFLLFSQPTLREKTVLVPIRKSEALKGVIEASQHFALDSKHVFQHLELLSALVRQTTAYQLLAGKDVFNNPRGFEELLLDQCQKMA